MSKSKRTPALDPVQFAFTFDPPTVLDGDAALAGLGKQISSAVAQMLKGDARPRQVVAASVCVLLGADVGDLHVDTLNKYASESSTEHNITLERFLALVAETGRYDVLSALLAKIGARLVVGEEIYTVELGHLEAQKQSIDERIRHLRRVAPLISGGPRK